MNIIHYMDLNEHNLPKREKRKINIHASLQGGSTSETVVTVDSRSYITRYRLWHHISF